MKKYTYNLTFQEVLKELFEDNSPCFYQGEHSANGVVFLKYFGELTLRIFSPNNNTYEDCTPFITQGAYDQKYRRVTSKADAERKV